MGDTESFEGWKSRNNRATRSFGSLSGLQSILETSYTILDFERVDDRRGFLCVVLFGLSIIRRRLWLLITLFFMFSFCTFQKNQKIPPLIIRVSRVLKGFLVSDISLRGFPIISH